MEQMRACTGRFAAAYERARSDLIDVPTSPIRLDGILLPLFLNKSLNLWGPLQFLGPSFCTYDGPGPAAFRRWTPGKVMGPVSS